MTIEEDAVKAFDEECPEISAMKNGDNGFERSMASTYWNGFLKGYSVARGAGNGS